jgi:hypothetical protein
MKRHMAKPVIIIIGNVRARVYPPLVHPWAYLTITLPPPQDPSMVVPLLQMVNDYLFRIRRIYDVNDPYYIALMNAIHFNDVVSSKKCGGIAGLSCDDDDVCVTPRGCSDCFGVCRKPK